MLHTIYMNAIKTLHDISPHFKRAVILPLAIFLLFISEAGATTAGDGASFLFVGFLFRSCVCLFAHLCKYFLFVLVQSIFSMQSKRFINEMEFSSAVSHICHFFNSLFSLPLHLSILFTTWCGVCSRECA